MIADARAVRTDDRRITVDTTERPPFEMVPAALIDPPCADDGEPLWTISDGAVRLWMLLALGSFGQLSRPVAYSHRQLAERRGVTTRTVGRWLAELEGTGWITVETRFDPATGWRVPSAFKLHWQPIPVPDAVAVQGLSDRSTTGASDLSAGGAGGTPGTRVMSVVPDEPPPAVRGIVAGQNQWTNMSTGDTPLDTPIVDNSVSAGQNQWTNMSTGSPADPGSGSSPTPGPAPMRDRRSSEPVDIFVVSGTTNMSEPNKEIDLKARETPPPVGTNELRRPPRSGDGGVPGGPLVVVEPLTGSNLLPLAVALGRAVAAALPEALRVQLDGGTLRREALRLAGCGWEPEVLAAAVRARGWVGARSAGLVINFLRDLTAPPARQGPGNGSSGVSGRSSWCGMCDDPRSRYISAPGGGVMPCPRCGNSPATVLADRRSVGEAPAVPDDSPVRAEARRVAAAAAESARARRAADRHSTSSAIAVS